MRFFALQNDFVAKKPHLLGALPDVSESGRHPPTMNVVLRLASLGGAVRLATRVGCDAAGNIDALLHRLAAHYRLDTQRPSPHVSA